MKGGQIAEILGGIASALAIVSVLARISWQLGGFQAELRSWRAVMERRVDNLEAAVYVPRHRDRKRPADGQLRPPGAP